MFESFFVPQLQTMGVDLSDRSLKIARVRETSRGKELSGIFETEVPLGLMVEGRVRNREGLKNLLRETFASAGAKHLFAPYAVVSLPEESCFIRMLQLPLMPEQEMAHAVSLELEGLIPLDQKEAYLDWRIIGAPQEKHVDLLVAAAHRDTIQEYHELFSGIGVTLAALEPESIATVRAVLKEDLSYPPLLIVDIGGVHTAIMIASGTTLRATAFVGISGRSFTERISRELRIPFREAEQRKREFGILPSGEGEKNLEATIPLLTDLSEQLRGYLEFYRTHAFHEHELYTLAVRSGASPDTFNFRPVSRSEVRIGRAMAGQANITKVVLTGGGAALKGFAEYLASALGVSIELGDSFANVAKAPAALREAGEGVRFSVAIGLAMHDLPLSLRVV